MNIRTLTHFGLTEPQAKAYISLVKSGSLTAKQLAAKIKQSRTNTYMVLEKLVELGLILKNEEHKILRFYAASPVQLQNIAEAKRREALEHEKSVKDAMPALLSYYYTYQNQPGIRFFQGVKGIAKMYEDQRRTMADIHFLRSDADFDMLGDILFDHIEKRAKLGITTYGIESNTVRDRELSRQDARLHRHIVRMPNGVFTAPVNLYVYGNKVGLISYGEEAMGTIIESPQLAVAFKQMFNLIRVAAPVLMRAQKKKGSVADILASLPPVQ